MNGPVHLLMFCGNLREPSSSSALLRAFEALVPSTFTVSHYDRMAELPRFASELTGKDLPLEVADLRDQVAEADALVIATPGSAQGLSGAFSNALDWLVSSAAAMGKHVALLSGDGDSNAVRERVSEALRAMSAHIIPEASPRLALPSGPANERTIIAQAHLRKAIFRSIDAISEAISVA